MLKKNGLMEKGIDYTFLLIIEYREGKSTLILS